MPVRKHCILQNTKPILATWQANIHKPEKIEQFRVQQTWCLFHFLFWKVKIRSVPKPIILQQYLP